jgi:hypothetical protein
MRKLNCLIAVLEVAGQKVRQSMTGSGADVERLGRIHQNLRSTLEVCLRARKALERRDVHTGTEGSPLAQALEHETLPGHATPRRRAPRRPAPLETSSEGERAKFERLAPIERDELERVDLDGLIRLLGGL